MRQITYAGPGDDATIFAEDAGRVWLRRLCGVTCGNDGEETGPAAIQGPAILVTSLGRFEGTDFQAVDRVFDARHRPSRLVGRRRSVAAGNCLVVLPENGRRQPQRSPAQHGFRSRNRLPHSVAVRFSVGSLRSLCPAEPLVQREPRKVASLARRQPAIRLRARGTTQGGTPYMCLREIDADRGVAFHVLPCGNWLIEVAGRSNADGIDRHPFAVVNLGLADDDLRLELPPGEAIECPEVLVQSLPGGEPRRGELHRWWQCSRHMPRAMFAHDSCPEDAGGVQYLVRPV